jgi:drug/metabolite transporter (DMT)-like permease
MTTLDTEVTAPGFGARVRQAGERHPVGLVTFGVVAFSAGPVMVAGADVSGPVFSFWRLWCGAAALLVLATVHIAVTGVWPTRRGVRWSLLAGVAFGLHQLLFMTALLETSVVDVTLMNTVAPIVVAVLAVPMFDERPGAEFRIWSLVAIAGAGAVALLGSAGPEGHPVGMLLAAGNVVFYSLYFVWSKQARDDIDTLPFLCITIVVAAVLVSSYVLLAGEPVGAITGHDLGLAAGVALVPGLVGHFSVTWPLRWVPANLPPVLMLTIPVMSGFMAWLLLGQSVEPLVMLAGGVTLAGVAGAVLSGRDLVASEALDLAEES